MFNVIKIFHKERSSLCQNSAPSPMLISPFCLGLAFNPDLLTNLWQLTRGLVGQNCNVKVFLESVASRQQQVSDASVSSMLVLFCDAATMHFM